MPQTASAARKRRSPDERRLDAKVERVRAEVAAQHPHHDECVFSSWGPHELYVAVWENGHCIGNYVYIEED